MPEWRSMFQRLINGRKPSPSTTAFELVNTQTGNFIPWSGNVYDNDIARAAIWTTAEAAGKASFIHTRGEGTDMRRFPDPAIRAVLEQPNEYMTMQDFIEKMVTHLEKHNNAFALINRDTKGRPVALYPLDYSSVSLRESKSHDIYCHFRFRGIRDLEVPYHDVIHLRKHFDKDEFFGDSNMTALSGLMEIITTTDQGIINAVRNSAVVSWLLKFKVKTRPEDVDETIKAFSEKYLKTSANGWGAAPTDPTYDAEQVRRDSFVPNAPQMNSAIQRIYAYFGVNEAIIQKKYDEQGWNAWYEAKIEPIVMQIAQQMTMKFFTMHERAFNNKIVPESMSLQYASMRTKLSLLAMVDRGAMLPNEWRNIMNLSPIEGGDVPVRRADTPTIRDGDAKTKTPGNLEQSPEEVPEMDEQRNQNPRADRQDRIFEIRSAETRSADDQGEHYVEGRAVVYDVPTLMYEYDGIKYFEVIARGALNETDMSDVPMRYNHSQSFMIVARHNASRPNRSNMELLHDESGLMIRADLSRTTSGRQLHEAINAGLVDKMSFAFSVDKDGETYDQATHTRTIIKIKKLWDVSAVDTPAYDTTSIYARNFFAAEAERASKAADAAEGRKRALDLEITTLLAIHEQGGR